VRRGATRSWWFCVLRAGCRPARNSRLLPSIRSRLWTKTNLTGSRPAAGSEGCNESTAALLATLQGSSRGPRSMPELSVVIVAGDGEQRAVLQVLADGTS